MCLVVMDMKWSKVRKCRCLFTTALTNRMLGWKEMTSYATEYHTAGVCYREFWEPRL